MNNIDERKPYAIGHKDGNKVNNSIDNLEWIKMPIKVADGVMPDDPIRSIEDIQKYENEAFDKVWLTRTHFEENRVVEIKRKNNVDRILSTYVDIPKAGYSDWECGYWNGIMGALRWVLGDTRDFLDT